MDYVGLIGFGILMVVFLVVIGLSLTSASLNYEEGEDYYGYGQQNYYSNPLFKYNSKYFHYRPKGSVILTKSKWAEIEKNIGIEIGQAREYGRKAGYRQALGDLKDSVALQKKFPTPYAVLHASSGMSSAEIGQKYKDLKKIYDPNNFKHLDSAFMELAEIRCHELDNAWKKVTLALPGRSLSK